MSALLESLITDDKRLADLRANDAAEAEAIRADLTEPTPEEKERRRVREAALLEMTYHSRMGWNF